MSKILTADKVHQQFEDLTVHLVWDGKFKKSIWCNMKSFIGEKGYAEKLLSVSWYSLHISKPVWCSATPTPKQSYVVPTRQLVFHVLSQKTKDAELHSLHGHSTLKRQSG